MKCKTIVERLYLSKGVEEIYIECPKLPQHQINALRFMFTQYKKKNPGVILNDPVGYGKTIEVVLFINSIKHALKKPALIICDEGEVSHWLANFFEWANLSAEIAVNPSNPYVKEKKIIISSWSGFLTYRVRNWSILVIHQDEPKKELFKYDFNADFKIWITSDDMKKNLESFIKIYEWIYPKSHIHLLPHQGTEVEKQIHRDAFMQDVVIRGDGYETPETRTEKVKIAVQQTETATHKKKNKDATGTKTKRSRKVVEEANPKLDLNTIKQEALEADENLEFKDHIERNGEGSTNLCTSTEIKKLDMSLDNNGPIKRIKIEQNWTDKELNNGVTSKEDCILNNIKVEVMDIEPSMKSMVTEFREIAVNASINDILDETDASTQSMNLRYSETDPSIMENSVQMDVDTDSPNLLGLNHTITKVVEIDNNHSNVSNKTSYVKEYKETNNISNENSFANSISNINKNESLKEEVLNDDNDQLKSSTSLNGNSNSIVSDINKNIKEIDQEMKENDVEMHSEVSKSIDNKTNRSFDSIMEEMEQKAMKKFKGSFLDSLF